MTKYFNFKNFALLFFVMGQLAGSLQDAVFQDKDKYARSFATMEFLLTREFRRGDISVHLIGMRHVSSQSFYSNINSYVAKYPSALTLTEGVLDNDNLFQDVLYDKIAVGGLKTQRDQLPEAIFPNPRWADVGTGQFRPKTKEFVRLHFKALRMKDYADFERLAESGIRFEDVEEDLLTKRNNHLINIMNFEIRSGEYRDIIIPWGARHMDDVEKFLTDRDFKQVNQMIFYSHNIIVSRIRNILDVMKLKLAKTQVASLIKVKIP